MLRVRLSTAMLLAIALSWTLKLAAADPPAIGGALRVWQTVTIDFHGPKAQETDNTPNPFLDFRCQVSFTGPSGRKYDVPGYFDGDGSGNGSGDVWRVRFTPDEPGRWSFAASFRTGKGAAIASNATEGQVTGFDGQHGEFEIKPRDTAAPGFQKWGRLEYIGARYLKFRDGPYWIRGGTDEPENLLAYAGFDDTPPSHKFAAHVEDWRAGDPDWGNGKGKGIIGALNYLASKNVNSMYFLTMNIGGDGRDVWPFVHIDDPKGSPANDNLHYDISKLAQWEIVFAHAQRKGIFLHFVLNEGEEANKRELDDGELGTERKLYYREVVARFSHHLALEWNLCEEYNLGFNLGADRVRAFAGYVQDVDPYDHPVTVHSAGDPLKQLQFTFGDKRFSLTSIQLNQRPIHEVTKQFWHATAAAGRPLPISLDEFTLDRGQKSSATPVDEAEGHRREKLWPTYLSGGMIEFILDDLLKTDSFKTRERDLLWTYVWYARRFMEQELPFWEMAPSDSLVKGGAVVQVRIGRGNTAPLGPQVFAKAGEVYAIYFPTATATGELDLSAARGDFQLRWYNPRTGEFAGAARAIQGGASTPLGEPPADPAQDWVAVVKRK